MNMKRSWAYLFVGMSFALQSTATEWTTAWTAPSTAKAGTNWSSTAVWQGGTVPGSSAGDSIAFTALSNNGTLTNDYAQVTLGGMQFLAKPGKHYTITTNTSMYGFSFNNNGAGAWLVNSTSETSGNVTLNNPITIADHLYITNNATGSSVITLNGGISERTPGRMVEIVNPAVTNGGVTFFGPSTFSGGIYIKSGMAKQANNAATNVFGTGTVYLGHTSGSDSATLAPKSGTLSFSNPIIAQAGSTGTLTIYGPGAGGSANLTGPVTINRTVVMDAGNSTGSYLIFKNNVITGTGDIILNSRGNALGTLLLQGTSQGYSGSVVVSNSTLRLSNNSALNATNAILLNTGATLDVQNSVTIAGLEDNAGAGGTVLNNNANTSRTLMLAGTNVYSFAGAITDGNGMLSLTKGGSGTQVLAGVNTYTGLTTVTQGTLALGCNTALDTDNDMTLGGGTLDAGTYSNALRKLTLNTGTASTLKVNDGTCRLSFTGMDATATGTLTITGRLNAATLRFGTDATSLSASQLAAIRANGQKVYLDANGYLLEVPRGTQLKFF